MRVVVRIESGPDAGEERTLEPGQVLRVGRTKPSDWCLEHDPRMGNNHFDLECDERTCRFREVRTRFGTKVNGVKLTEAQLRDGDRIEAGTTTFRVRIEGGVPAPAAPPPVAQPASAPVAPPAPAVAVVAPADRGRRVQEMLRKEAAPLYVLLDAARGPQVLAVVQ